MPIKVTCSSCGRNGRVPDHAIGKNVQCPACGFRRRLSAADVVAEGPAELDGLELLDDAPLPPVSSNRDFQDLPAQSVPPTVKPRRDSRAQGREASTPSDRTPTRNPLYLGLGVGFGVGILFLAIVVVLVANRTPQPQPEQAAANKPVAQAAAVQPIAQREPPLASTPAPHLKPSVPVLPKRNPSDGDLAASNPTIKPAAESGTDEPDVATQARTALAGSIPQPGSASAPTPAPQPNSTKAADSRADKAGSAVLSTAEIVARYEPSIALIKGKAGSGTGFLVAPGILATNSHVIDGEFIGNLEIRFPSADEARKGPVQAELLYEDAKRDLAFLAVKSDLPALEVAQSYQYRKGEDVTVIGNPGVDGDTVLENAISRGVMSTKAEIDGQQFYQLGIAVNPGNSGGPVFDSTGQVIGVVTLRIPGKEELSFCIPIEELRAGITRLKEQAPSLANEVRSQHRMLTAFKGLGSGGAIYGVALELSVAARANPGDQDLKAKAGRLDEALAKLDRSLLFKLSEEARTARNDPIVSRASRTKFGELADNYKKLRETYKKNQGNASIPTIRTLKATHRRLVVQIGADLKEEVPKGILEALDDHLVTGPSMAMEMEVPFPSAGSLHSRIWERHGLTPPSSRLAPPGFGSPSSRLRPPGFGPGPGMQIPGRLGPRSRFGR